MARKRPTLRGQGADVFLAPAPTPTPPPTPTTAEPRVMVTVYLPEPLVAQLDQAWLTRRVRDRKAQKSHLVAEALAAYLPTLLTSDASTAR